MAQRSRVAASLVWQSGQGKVHVTRARLIGRLAALLVAVAFVTAVSWTVRPGTTFAHQLASISPGFDLFETDPGSTHFNFQGQCTTIPPGFFGPGSDPFQGTVQFGGVPLGSFNGHFVGDADTIVQRLQAADPNPDAVVPIELVQLSLVSVQPITVRYGSTATVESWNVSVDLSPSQPSQGVIHINQPLLGSGGTFDSQLQVIPRLTFTRISDGQTRTLDAAGLPPQCQSALVLQQTGGVWQPGCVLPALAVPGLNDGFCPGLTPQGEKHLTVEQSLLADHGVYPAQPSLEHFKCYTLSSLAVKARSIVLMDQFLSGPARTTGRAELCNPTQKNTEPFVNKTAHLQCYKTSGPDVNKAVAVQNQFGSQQLVVHSPRRLCLPTQKRLLPKPFPPGFNPKTLDPFRCYAVTPAAAIQSVQPVGTVTLRDEFGRERVKVGQPVQLCAPVAIQAGPAAAPMRHPVKHLVCYRIKDAPVNKKVQILNGFERPKLVAISPVMLCVPSNKIVLP